MSEKQKMINTAAGASPPWYTTHDRACSPIHFESSIESTSTRDFDNSRVIYRKERQSQHKTMLMNKYVEMYYISSHILKVKRTKKFKIDLFSYALIRDDILVMFKVLIQK